MAQPTLDDLARWRAMKNHRSNLAMCNTCGTVREAKKPRNYDCVTETGDLKCVNCDSITRHSLITGRNFDEQEYAIALGMPKYNGKTETAKQDLYRRNFNTNPKLDHWSYLSDRQAAYDRGESQVRALCGEMFTYHSVKSHPGRAVQNSQVKPEGDTVTREYDPDDHGEWRAMDCPNCLRVWHNILAHRRRKKLTELMIVAIAELAKPQARLYDPHAEQLIEILRAVHGEGE